MTTTETTTGITAPGSPPAGWYDDPSDTAGSWRWWDGIRWSDQTGPKFLPPVEAAPAAPPPPPAPAFVAPGEPFAPVEAFVPQASSYVPFANAAAHAADRYAVNAAETRVGSPHTVGVWLLASLPFVSLFLTGLSGVVSVLSGLVIPPLAAYPILIGLAWLFAGLDRGALRSRGYSPPSIWWMLLLPPLIYLIARGRVVRAEKQRAWPPELLYIGGIVLLMIVSAVGAVASAPYSASGSVPLSGGSSQAGDQTDAYRSGAPGTSNGIVIDQENSAGSIPDESQPWQAQIESSIEMWDGIAEPGFVDCSRSVSEIALSSTFWCDATPDGVTFVDLSVTVSELGNIGYTAMLK